MSDRRWQWCCGCDEFRDFERVPGFDNVRCTKCKIWMKPQEKNMGIGGDLMADAERQVLEIRSRMGNAAFDKFAASLTPKPVLPTKDRSGHPGFYGILEEMAALHEKKASDYGLGKDVLANCRGSEEFGIPAWIGVVMRMNDKMTRLKSFAQKGVLANESAEDSLLDMARYSLIALILMREGK